MRFMVKNKTIITKEIEDDIEKSNEKLLKKYKNKESVDLAIVGEIKTMNCGEEAKIIKYYGCCDVLVQFKNSGEIIKTNYGNFKNKNVKSHFSPSVLGKGIVGNEDTKINGKHIESYKIWRSMLNRCYNNEYQIKHPTYIGCSVCDEWLYYPNFKKWYDENYYTIKGNIVDLDKDIIVKNNKIYSPDTCVFVPQNINKLFTKRNKYRGELPIGLSYDKKSGGKVRAQITINGTRKSLGLFPNTQKGIQEAFQTYKFSKEKYIKQIADEYKNIIPDKLYKAMYNYEVEIND